MKILAICIFLVFSISNLFADQWDGFFKESGFPRKIIDDGSVVRGKIYDAKVSYQIKNNDGIKGNFQNSDSAKIVIVGKDGKVLSTNKFLNEKELRAWANANFSQIFAMVIGDSEVNREKLFELSKLASAVLSNKKFDNK